MDKRRYSWKRKPACTGGYTWFTEVPDTAWARQALSICGHAGTPRTQAVLQLSSDVGIDDSHSMRDGRLHILQLGFNPTPGILIADDSPQHAQTADACLQNRRIQEK